MLWFHKDREINYEGSRGRVTVKTENDLDLKRVETRSTRSVLVIKNAEPSHSGNYTCQPSNARGASITVFVSEGEVLLLSEFRGTCHFPICKFSEMNFDGEGNPEIDALLSRVYEMDRLETFVFALGYWRDA